MRILCRIEGQITSISDISLDKGFLSKGDPLNYLKAILTYAVDRKDINGELLKYLQELEGKKAV